MATFSKDGFNADSYMTYRPTYNKNAYSYIFEVHQGDLELAVDVGCGPGTVTIELAKWCRQVIGIDPSNSMIEVAQKTAQQQGLQNVTYRQGYGEQLPLEDQSVDILTVAQSLHWLDPSKFLSEVKRVLRPKGTLVAWGYMFGKLCFDDNTSQQEYQDTLAQLGDPDKGGLLGSYWEKNRAIATAGFVSWLPEFQKVFKKVQHLSYPTLLTPSSMILTMPWMDDSDISFHQLIAYVKTWSSYKNWLDAKRQQHDDDDDGDIVDTFFKNQFPSVSLDTLVHVQWPHSVFIVSNPYSSTL
ncbi:S-adenosyl-L-methionine-dependent methyltransferase [Halteromyces radiatus]|uniref:S-adenosyl-L-methionine-dependent methyltransferase n=1 Tax=Halteromyces radiatus TaxID=101107 RepID=UPI00221E555A|nr:S-adenosyl-L-methionine-dependent methyltransferase [Halteromyces radiatus]KAI8082965.1 S-adenosyl-L-methionine-dependent methyltransferase [Halteromyces radiatus]